MRAERNGARLSQAAFEGFDQAFLKKLEYLHVVARKVFAGRMRAERRSRKTGAGVEFADHRDYAPGDDPRYLDWSVYGRMDRLLGGPVAVLTVRPCRVPQVRDRLLRSGQLDGEVHELAAQLRKDVAEPGGVLSRTRQALDQPYRYGVANIQEYDRNGRGLPLGRYRCA